MQGSNTGGLNRHKTESNAQDQLWRYWWYHAQCEKTTLPRGATDIDVREGQ